eukprot:5412834-Pyramimonas_sp.AAC.1
MEQEEEADEEDAEEEGVRVGTLITCRSGGLDDARCLSSGRHVAPIRGAGGSERPGRGSLRTGKRTAFRAE